MFSTRHNNLTQSRMTVISLFVLFVWINVMANTDADVLIRTATDLTPMRNARGGTTYLFYFIHVLLLSNYFLPILYKFINLSTIISFTDVHKLFPARFPPLPCYSDSDCTSLKGLCRWKGKDHVTCCVMPTYFGYDGYDVGFDLFDRQCSCNNECREQGGRPGKN